MLQKEERIQLEKFAAEIRSKTIRQLATRGFGHVGGSMSIVEILSVLYNGGMKIDPSNPKWEDRDWLVCSKGHAGPAVYSTLAMKGFFPEEWLSTLNTTGTNLPSHCDRNKTPGIDVSTGSLGQGISLAAGVAASYKMDGKDNTVFCILGDGECQEGQVWEAALFAAHNKLSNLVLLIDDNKVQLDGATAVVNNMESFEEKFKAFHFNTISIDGHDVEAIWDAVAAAKAESEKPTAIILNTIKGKDCSFAEGKFNHHIPVTEEQAAEGIAFLEAKIKAMEV